MKTAKNAAKKLAKETVGSAGKAFRKTLDVTIPPEILNNSSFFGGMNRMAAALVEAGEAGEENQAHAREYMVRHTGGVAADVAVGMLTFGVPVTMVTSLFSDGCKVVSYVFTGAKTADQEYTEIGELFGDFSTVSNDFMMLFDVPSRKQAEKIHESIGATRQRLLRQGRLTKKIEDDLRELEEMCFCEIKDERRWSDKVQERLKTLAADTLKESSVKIETAKIHDFLRRPNISNLSGMEKSMVSEFRKKNISIKKSTLDFVSSFVTSFEKFSSRDFLSSLRSAIIANYGSLGKTHDAMEESVYYGYRLIHSIFSTTYKGAALFEGHYRRQINELIRGEKDRSQQ